LAQAAASRGEPGPGKEEPMRYLVVPVLLVLLLFYLADQYFTHGAYFNAFAGNIRDFLDRI
jgi:hypothetical protein